MCQEVCADGRGACSGLGGLPGGPGLDGSQRSAGLLAGESVAGCACLTPHTPAGSGRGCCRELSGTDPLVAFLMLRGWAEVAVGHQPLPFQVVNRLGLDSLSPFNPKERIIE